MRPSSCCFWVALLLFVGVCAAQAPPPADCNAAIVSLVPCLDYVQGNVSTPPANCCVGLAAVVQSSPSCLCVLANNSALPIQVDPSRVSQLPGICNVTTPSPIVCGGGVAPIVSPVSEPVPSPPVSPPATPPAASPPAGTPPPTPVVAPSAPVTPVATPSTPPSTAPTPIVAPAVPPPAPTPAEVPTPSTTPTVPPALAPSSSSPLPSLSSPPSPPPANDNNHGAAIGASVLISGFAMMLSSILFLQF